jgi:hypothetical protein
MLDLPFPLSRRKGLCAICGTAFHGAPAQKTCGEPKCSNEHMRRRKATYYARKNARKETSV